jgi:hypothetical protein
LTIQKTAICVALLLLLGQTQRQKNL